MHRPGAASPDGILPSPGGPIPGPFISASRPGAVESDRDRGDSSGGEPIPMTLPSPSVRAAFAPFPAEALR